MRAAWKIFLKTIHKLPIGVEKPPNRVIPGDNVSWACVMPMAREYPKIMSRLSIGFVKPLSKVMPGDNTIWACVMPMVREYPRIMSRRFIGIANRPSGEILMLNVNWD